MMRGCLAGVVIVLGLCHCDREEPVPEESPPAKPPGAKLREDRYPDHQSSIENLHARRDSAKALPEGPERERAVAGVAWNALELDPELSKELLEELQPGTPDRIRLIGHLAMRLADESPTAAVDWAAAIEDSSERQEAFARVAVVMANKDPVGASELLFKEVEEGRVRDRSTVQIIQRWSQTDPSSAAEWVRSFPAGRMRIAALRACLDPWIKSAPSTAASWINDLSDADLQSDAVLVVKPMISTQPDEAREAFTDAITNPQVLDDLR